MRADASFAVPVKLWALLCVFVGVNLVMTCFSPASRPAGRFFIFSCERHFRLAVSYGCFYLVLAITLYGIRFHGLHMPIFSEFYVLMFWKLSPIFRMSWGSDYDPAGNALCLFLVSMPTSVILGLLVFRFFPTMRAELRSGQVDENRGLTRTGNRWYIPYGAWNMS